MDEIKTAVTAIFDEIIKTGALILRSAADDEIKSCNRDMEDAGCIPIPGEYVEFLKISNGFAWNGFEFYGTYQVRENSSGYILNDIVSVNESDEYIDRNVLILGACDEDYYVYNAENKKYQCFDRMGRCEIETYESFIDMIKEEVGGCVLRSTAENRIIKIICDHFGKKENEITLDFNIVTGLALDFLDLTELSIALEEEFEILIDDEDAGKWNTVNDIVEYVKEAEKNFDEDNDDEEDGGDDEYYEEDGQYDGYI